MPHLYTVNKQLCLVASFNTTNHAAEPPSLPSCSPSSTRVLTSACTSYTCSVRSVPLLTPSSSPSATPCTTHTATTYHRQLRQLLPLNNSQKHTKGSPTRARPARHTLLSTRRLPPCPLLHLAKPCWRTYTGSRAPYNTWPACYPWWWCRAR